MQVCEASLASARMGMSTALLTINLDTIAQMSCNPAIGGLAKGQLVREIDALGGEMAKVTDETGIQFRMLNTKKGPPSIHHVPKPIKSLSIFHEEKGGESKQSFLKAGKLLTTSSLIIKKQ